jgi:hypothetical protein
MGMLSLECPASPFLLEESSRLAPFLEPEATAGAGFRRKCLVFNVRASDARLDVFPYRVIRIDGVAVARVRVREDRDLHGQDNFRYCQIKRVVCTISARCGILTV